MLAPLVPLLAAALVAGGCGSPSVGAGDTRETPAPIRVASGRPELHSRRARPRTAPVVLRPGDEVVLVREPPGPVEAAVLAVRPEKKLVMLSAGSADDAREGMRFTIFRGEEYIGKVEVEKVFEDMSSARVLVDWTRQEIKEGDAASTRVY